MSQGEIQRQADFMSQFWIMRMAAYDTYAAAALSMSLHPGTTRDQPHPRSPEQIAAIADMMLAERDKRFPTPNSRSKS